MTLEIEYNESMNTMNLVLHSHNWYVLKKYKM